MAPKAKQATRTTRAMLERSVDSADTVRILLVENDLALARVANQFLAEDGFVVDDLLVDALPVAPIGGYGLVLLDLSRPVIDTPRVLASIRQASDLPVIILSQPANDGPRIVAFRLDADELAEPMAPVEFRARIRAVLRRAGVLQAAHVLRFGALTIDLAARAVEVGGVAGDLTRREFDLLAYLVCAEGRVCSRAELLTHVWASSPDWQDADTVTEHVRRIRHKLNPAGTDDGQGWIRTVRGVGYRFESGGARRAAHAS